MASWKEKLQGDMPPLWAEQIDDFDTQITLRKAGKIDEKVFAETRLRRGAYGQRYDNGQRHDGITTQTLPYSGLTKGPETLLDAPGMQRIKIPFGGMNPEQMRVLADLAEEYSDQICHITTRQDIQLHYVHIDDTPDIFRRLAAVGITTREACGNSVRNVTACPLAGVCNTESFDVTPYAKATAFYLLGHRDTQDFGRKFKIAFSGCRDEACGLVTIHDLGGIAAIKDGKARVRVVRRRRPRRGAAQGEAADGVLPGRRAAADGPRDRTRLRATGREEKPQQSPAEIRRRRSWASMNSAGSSWKSGRRCRMIRSWKTFFDEIPHFDEKPGEKLTQLTVNRRAAGAGFERWEATNVYQQRQAGYAVVTVACPLGDLTSRADAGAGGYRARYSGGNVRTTIDQNLVLRWVPAAKITDLYRELQAIGLSDATAGTIVDVIIVPGNRYLQAGHRLLARTGRRAAHAACRANQRRLDEAIKNLHIKVSGCFNSCGQHHVADIGFYGNSRNVNGFTVPHFQVMLGGQWTENAASYALAMGAVPSKKVPLLLEALTQRYSANVKARKRSRRGAIASARRH